MMGAEAFSRTALIPQYPTQSIEHEAVNVRGPAGEILRDLNRKREQRQRKSGLPKATHPPEGNRHQKARLLVFS